MTRPTPGELVPLVRPPSIVELARFANRHVFQVYWPEGNREPMFFVKPIQPTLAGMNADELRWLRDQIDMALTRFSATMDAERTRG